MSKTHPVDAWHTTKLLLKLDMHGSAKYLEAEECALPLMPAH